MDPLKDRKVWARGVLMALFDAGRCGALAVENNRLKERIAEFENEMVFEHNVWWRTSPTGGRTGPFCPKCWGREKRLNPLGDANEHRWRCAACDFSGYMPGGQDRMSEAARRAAERQRMPDDDMRWN